MKIFFLAFIALQITLVAQTKVGFLNLNDELKKNAEVKAAYNFLRNQKDFSTEQIKYADVINSLSSQQSGGFSIQQFSIIWIHRPDTTKLSSQETKEQFIRGLQNYVKNGGKLFLTLDALKYLNALGFELETPQVKYVDAADDGYGRRLGLHSFRSHPIFNGLNGGAYIFNPTKNMKARQIGYFENSIPQNGKVAAVDWAYITLNENSKLVLEYEIGKGKVLAVGAYTQFAVKNNNRTHLELFVNNCLNYLADKFHGAKTYYWNYTPCQILPFNYQPANEQPAKPQSSSEWNKNRELMILANPAGAENFWDVAGQRMLVMGKEKAGIDEIWAHPFMALRDYEIGILFNDDYPVQWLKDYSPQIEVRPGSFTRIYKIGNTTLTEIISASITEPAAVMHYEYRGTAPAKLIVKFKSNMRYMWPYSEKALGSIFYMWDEKNSSFILKNDNGEFAVVAGANRKPSLQIAGRFENFEKAGSTFKGAETEKFFVGALARYDLQTNDNLDFVISASSEGLQGTKEVFNKTVDDPGRIYNEATQYTREFLNNSLMITSPDKNFNEGYRWALFGADRFFVNTPGIGKSLVAGYSTTATGWDGGHKVNGRPGYSWYFGRDGSWSGFALLDYGDFDKVKEMLEFFNKYQDLNGKIFHELTTSGAVHYDASDATPLYIILAGKYLRHTGDTEFIKRNWQHIKRAIDFCYSTDTDKDHLIENTNVGHGWVEGGGLYTAHTEVYLAACWSAALREASIMANAIGETAESITYNKESEAVKKIINEKYWSKEKNFLSFSKLKNGKFNSEKTVLAAVPVYFDMLDSIKAKKVVNAYAENYFSSDWGVRILREDSPIFNPRGYHTGSVWPLFTGWTALAEYKNRNYTQGFSHIMNNLLVYKNWALGFVEEVLNGAEYKPSGVCRHQCWSQTMVLQPTIEGMLGLEADALNSRLKLSPHFPADWDSVKVENIKVGYYSVDMKMKRVSGKTIYEFTNSSNYELAIDFSPTFPSGTKFKSAFIDGKPAVIDNSGFSTINFSFTLGKSAKIEIEHNGGIAVLPNVVLPKVNSTSDGFRILSDKLNGNNYEVVVQGKSENKNEMKVYAADGKINSVENGKIISREKSIYTIAVEFEKSSSKYVNRTVRMKIER